MRRTGFVDDGEINCKPISTRSPVDWLKQQVSCHLRFCNLAGHLVEDPRRHEKVDLKSAGYLLHAKIHTESCLAHH